MTSIIIKIGLDDNQSSQLKIKFDSFLILEKNYIGILPPLRTYIDTELTIEDLSALIQSKSHINPTFIVPTMKKFRKQVACAKIHNSEISIMASIPAKHNNNIYINLIYISGVVYRFDTNSTIIRKAVL